MRRCRHPTSGRPAPHHRERLFRGAAAVFAGLRLADAELRMLAAPPVDRKDHLPRRLVDIGDDVRDQCTQQLLARAHGDARRAPGCRKILGEAGEVREWHVVHRLRQRIQTGRAGLHAAQRRLPVPLELRGDQAVVRIAGGVAPLGPSEAS